MSEQTKAEFLAAEARHSAPVRDDLEPHSAGKDDHDHGSAPAFLPHWIQSRWTLILVAVATATFLIAWIGETFAQLPANVALLFYLATYMAAGYDVASHALPGLLRGKFDTDVLMVAAALGAALLGAWAEGAFLLLLFAIGHAGEHYAMDRARNAIDALGALMPRVARVRRTGPAGVQIVETPVDQVLVGDVVVVRAGDRIPIDGEVQAGVSDVNQAPITGESVPVAKEVGDLLFAGSINGEGALDVRVTALARDNTLSRVMQMVAEAQSQQSPTQQSTQRIMAWFVPAVLIAVVLVMVVPPLVGWLSWTDALYRGLLLLVAASPCALAIGTPAAVLAGIAQAARNGVLIKGGAHLENLGKLDAIAFDKTGTLTEGRFVVSELAPLAGVSAFDLLALSASVEAQSSHPLAQAVVAAAEAEGIVFATAEGVENRSGRGLVGKVEGVQVMVGSPRLFEEAGLTVPDEIGDTVMRLGKQGASTMIVWRDDVFLGVIALADQPRAGVQATLQALRQLGVRETIMLTGDAAAPAQRMAQTVGVTDVRAGLLPEQKLEAIATLRATRSGIAMVGDGVNDAPALAAATVGIAMGGAGTAVALETADVALMADDLGQLPFAVGLSRASRAIVRQNLLIALGVILLLILASVLGVVALSGAVVLHEGSTILVVLNGLRLLRYRG